MPRATTAAWDVIPPRDVRIPFAAVHAEDVFGRRLRPDQDDRIAAVRHLDGALGGERGPPARGARPGRQAPARASLPAFGDRLVLFLGAGKTGASSCESCSGSTRVERLLGLRDPLLVDEVARDPHGGEAGALSVARLEDVELAALDRELDVLHVAEALLESLAARAGALRTPPASSPRANRRGPSPRSAAACGCRRRRPRPGRSGGTRRRTFLSPVAGLRVNATPVAQSSPRLPKTIACTVTAVPHVSGMWLSLRYVARPLVVPRRNTAPIAPQSCFRGSSGNRLPVLAHDLEVFASRVRELLRRELRVGLRRPRVLTAAAIASSNWCCGAPSARRRRTSRSAAAGSRARTAPPPRARSRPSSRRQAEVQDRVHHPGHRGRAPDRTETRSGVLAVSEVFPGNLLEAASDALRPRLRAGGISSRGFETSAQTDVEITKPGGTGIPSAVISTRPKPLPPRVSRPSRRPSAPPLPKKKTRLFISSTATISRRSRRSARNSRSSATQPGPWRLARDVRFGSVDRARRRRTGRATARATSSSRALPGSAATDSSAAQAAESWRKSAARAVLGGLAVQRRDPAARHRALEDVADALD